MYTLGAFLVGLQLVGQDFLLTPLHVGTWVVGSWFCAMEWSCHVRRMLWDNGRQLRRAAKLVGMGGFVGMWMPIRPGGAPLDLTQEDASVAVETSPLAAARLGVVDPTVGASACVARWLFVGWGRRGNVDRSGASVATPLFMPRLDVASGAAVGNRGPVHSAVG